MIPGSAVVIFVKFPEAGPVKSRLAGHVGSERARDIYTRFVLDMLDTLKEAQYPVRPYCYPPESADAMQAWLGDDLTVNPQRGEDLGERMKNAFAESFTKGFDTVLLIGSDTPDLPSVMIDKAFRSLREYDAVIGPAYDGGYYAIGFRHDTFLADIFHAIPWSTGSVFAHTMGIFRQRGYRVHALPEWRDVDTLEDLQSLFLRNIEGDFMLSRTMTYLRSNSQSFFGEGIEILPQQL